MKFIEKLANTSEGKDRKTVFELFEGEESKKQIRKGMSADEAVNVIVNNLIDYTREKLHLQEA